MYVVCLVCEQFPSHLIQFNLNNNANIPQQWGGIEEKYTLDGKEVNGKVEKLNVEWMETSGSSPLAAAPECFSTGRKPRLLRNNAPDDNDNNDLSGVTQADDQY